MCRASAVVALTIASLVSMFAGSAQAEDLRTDLSSRSERDPAAGRSYLGPTALTAPAGQATVTLRMPFYPAIAGSLAVGLTDRVEVFVGGGAAIIIFDESNYPARFVSGGAKLQVLRSRRAALALTASAYRRPAYFHSDPFDDGWNEPRLVVGEIGVVGSACLDDRCGVVASAHAHVIPEIWGGNEKTVWGGGSIVAGRGFSRLVADATVMSSDDDHGFVGYVGYRATGEQVAFDVGALIFGDVNDIVPWPTVGLSARF